ncbi:amylo-alpha-1,6-glucosidase [Spirilliplanes yamanashiensis]|nr:glycogen debranching N-terminal domain-containing protein [Spirilliplanes yamanashiensis]MDP9817264.1 glycogen debranching enzyme [Spirilliplanes yamanashiensis]
MTQPWTFAGAPGAAPAAGTVTLVEGSTFCISEQNGDVAAGHAQGLFVRDTRVLAGWRLTVDGRPAEALAAHVTDPYAAVFVGRLPPPGGGDSRLVTVRERWVGDGMREDLTVRNLVAAPRSVDVVLAVEADFADLFEVKEGRTEPPEAFTATAHDGGLHLTGTRRGHPCGVSVTGDIPAEVAVDADGGRLTWRVALAPHGARRITVEVVPVTAAGPMALRHPGGHPVEHSVPARMQRAWRRGSPSVTTGDAGLAAVLARSVDDLGALRIYDAAHPERAVVAAGAPWFMALFGRDSLLTSYMLLPLNAELALGTLQTLADRQGRVVDPATEEQPGRILHEVRFGPAAWLALGGSGVYYGTADATPLFVMLLGELARWGRYPDAVRDLLPAADRALAWIDEYGDADGDGFVEYARSTPTGLANQGWKDSHDGITFADGRLAEAPIALAEVQAYVYAAFRARSRFAAEAGDERGARHWRGRARRLRRAFNDAFWLPERGWYAVALDGDKRPVDALTSNVGHCLWTGIADRDKAARVADHLLSEAMFSGWGVRTLATTMGAYNPISYHNGSVWPHDTAICVAGLMRYGHTAHAQRVAEGLLDAAAHVGHRLPELFCGFARDDFAVPVPYPTSCSPQAWASAAPLLLLRSLLRFHPAVPRQRLHCDPAVPDRYLPLTVNRMRVAEREVDVRVDAHGWRLDGLDGTGIGVTGG